MLVKRSIKGTQTNWIKMQTETFINWININLSSRGMAITDIETAFEDGVKLVNLFEVISKRSIGKYAKNPKFHTQKMENVALVLRAMELDGVKVVSIDSDHVVKGNFKMLLGLIWQLILRYQVGGSDPESVKIVLKKLLLLWLQHVIPEQNIRNLTTDWNSGIALCNLVDVLKPGLCPDYNMMNKDTPVENVTKGLQLAKDALDIPQIISPEYMASPNVDDLSMTTYLSYFTQDKGIGEKWTSNLIDAWNPEIQKARNFSTDWTDGHALSKLVNTFAPGSIDDELLSNDNVENCRLAMDVALEKFGVQQIIKPEEMANPKIPELAIMAYVVQFSKLSESERFSVSGHGLQQAKLDEENEFHVSYPKCTILEHIHVVVLNPHNQILKTVFEDVGQRVRKYTYIPEEAGNYTINISYEGKQISQSPYLVHVLPNIDPHRIDDGEFTDTKLYAEINENIGISVDTRQSGKGTLTVITKGPDDTEYPSKVVHEVDGTETVSFTPSAIGKYQSTVLWNDKPIPQSPFIVLVSDPSKCVPMEPLTCKGRIGKKLSFVISTLDAGPGLVTSYAEYVEGDSPVEVTVTQCEESSYSCCFTPDKPGGYILHVNYSDCPIMGSPFDIIIYDRPNVNVTLDPDNNGEVSLPFSFTVEIQDEEGIGDLICFVNGPKNESILNELVKADTGKFVVLFTPVEEGPHIINVYYREDLIEDCPFTIEVVAPVCTNNDMDEIEIPIDPGKKLFAEVAEKIGISVDTRKSCDGRLSANTIGPEDASIYTEIVLEKDGTYTISFTPPVIGIYETNVFWNDNSIKGSPFTVWVCNPLKCFVKGPIINEAIVNNEIVFEVLTPGVGPGEIFAHVEYNQEIVDVEVTHLEEDCYRCVFVPTEAGEHLLNIRYNDSAITGSPFSIMVCDLSSIHLSIDDPNTETETNKIFTFDIYIKDNIGISTLECLIEGPDQKDIKNDIQWDGQDQVSRVSFLPLIDGCYKVAILYAGVPAKNCPFNVHALTPPPLNPPDATKVVIKSDSLSDAFVGDLIHVTVDATNAGIGELITSVQRTTQDEVVDVVEVDDGIYEITFTPQISAEYILNITWGTEHVPGSPYKIDVKDRTYPEAVVLEGKGLTEGIAGQPTTFTVDGRKAGPGEFHCQCRAPSGKMTDVLVSENDDGTQKVNLNASEPGLHTLSMKWGDEQIPGSPFLVKIMMPSDSKKVRAYGPGLISGVFESFRGIFYVDTKHGGAGALKVRVNGPKKCFKVEMYRTNPKDRIINVQYNPTVPGIYSAKVFWSDEHIPGSPFEIFVALKESHLEKWNKNRREEPDEAEHGELELYSSSP